MTEANRSTNAEHCYWIQPRTSGIVTHHVSRKGILTALAHEFPGIPGCSIGPSHDSLFQLCSGGGKRDVLESFHSRCSHSGEFLGT